MPRVLVPLAEGFEEIEAVTVIDLLRRGGMPGEDGKVITSRGPGTAMDFALALIERLAGRGVRQDVEGRLQRPAPALPVEG